MSKGCRYIHLPIQTVNAMKKKTLKKLSLKKETLNNLANDSQFRVRGGYDAVIDPNLTGTVVGTTITASVVLSCITCRFTQCNQNTCAITCISVCVPCPITNMYTGLNCCIA
jgi:hypothetical protein